MVDSVHRIFTEGRKAVDLRFIIGSSLGCMHSLMRAEIYPDLMDGIVGLSQPVEISGRNWIMPRSRGRGDLPRSGRLSLWRAVLPG
jgi:homoserine O-acetyltransferase/O-succinyltransferase